MQFPRVPRPLAACAATLACAALVALPQVAAADKSSGHGSAQEQANGQQGDNQNGHQGDSQNGHQGDNQNGQGGGDHQSSGGHGDSKPVKHQGAPLTHEDGHPAPTPVRIAPRPHPAAPARNAAATAAPTTAGGGVLSAATTTAPDPAPFSPTADLSRLAAQPVEPLGALTGISFGSGVVLWPVLVVLDLLGFALIIRGQLRRRRAPAEE